MQMQNTTELFSCDDCTATVIGNSVVIRCENDAQTFAYEDYTTFVLQELQQLGYTCNGEYSMQELFEDNVLVAVEYTATVSKL